MQTHKYQCTNGHKFDSPAYRKHDSSGFSPGWMQCPDCGADYKEVETPGPITADHFTKATGRNPMNDQLERVNCEKVGKLGHSMCGWCHDHDVPVTWCGGAWDGHDTLDPKFITDMREDNTLNETKSNQ